MRWRENRVHRLKCDAIQIETMSVRSGNIGVCILTTYHNTRQTAQGAAKLTKQDCWVYPNVYLRAGWWSPSPKDAVALYWSPWKNNTIGSWIRYYRWYCELPAAHRCFTIVRGRTSQKILGPQYWGHIVRLCPPFCLGYEEKDCKYETLIK